VVTGLNFRALLQREPSPNWGAWSATDTTLSLMNYTCLRMFSFVYVIRTMIFEVFQKLYVGKYEQRICTFRVK